VEEEKGRGYARGTSGESARDCNEQMNHVLDMLEALVGRVTQKELFCNL
jgi:hypothetical protein